MGKIKNTRVIAVALIVIGAIMAIIGLVCGGTFKVVGGFNGFKIYDSADLVNEKSNLNEFTDINVDISSGDIEIVTGDEYGIEVTYNKEMEDISFDVVDNKLTVKSKKDKFMFFNIGIITNETTVKVYVPSNVELNTLTVNNKSGSLSYNNINIKNSDINCDFGDVYIDGVNGEKINIQARSGQIDIANVKIKELFVFADFGDFSGQNIETVNFKGNLKSGSLSLNKFVANNAIINSDFGEVYGNDIFTNGINVEAKSGNIDINGELKGQNTLDSDFGDIKVKTSVPKSEYRLNVDMDFGNSVIDGNKTSGDYKSILETASNEFNVKCKSGNLTIDFIN